MENRDMKVGSNLPLSFRITICELIFSRVRAGESCSIVGISGMAKSNLYRHLLEYDVRKHYLKAHAPKFLFVGVDSHALNELSEKAMYAAVLESLVKVAGQQPTNRQILTNTDSSAVEIETWEEATNARNRLLHMIDNLMLEPDQNLVLLFDQFDEVYRSLPPRLFANLRSLRDTYKYRISYITFTRDELPGICEMPECEEFYELLQSNVIGLPPFNEEDAWVELKRIAGRSQIQIEKEIGDRLIQLSGAHPGLLKAAFSYVLIYGTRLPGPDKEAIRTLIGSNDVTIECKKIWNSLREDEREALRAISQGLEFRPTDDLEHRFQLKHLLIEPKQVFSPLFAEFITRIIAPQPISKIQAGAIRIDAGGEVWVRGKMLERELTASELRLLTLLAAKAGQICSKDEIDIDLHPNKYRQGELMSDAALDALVKRLRERIEENPSSPELILTIRGKGYMLRV